MITHYNAFISYRHVSRDISVARDVQSALEHYSIPKEVQDRYGIRKIERVFRDKDELSLSGDLSENIDDALRNSDWLIVICSKQACESEWVLKEIETFLSDHSFDRVLTVLSDGEPVDVVPERLTYRIEKKTLPDGSEEEERVPTEALACDYRMPFRKARREEIPRLVAAIIGCSYDELIRRAEQYRQKRNRIRSAIVGVSAAVVLGYLLWSNNKIQDNLKQSQKNQSRYLATESLSAFEDHDRLTAIELALAALPEKDNRLVVAEAEYALARSSGAYEIPGMATEMHSVSKYDSNSVLISDFWVRPDGTKLAYTDDDNYLNVIDLTDNSLVLERPMRPGSKVVGSTDDALIITRADEVKAVSWEDFSVLWNTEIGFSSVYSDLSRDGRILITDSDRYVVIDSSGSMIYSADISGENWIYDAHISPDGRYLSFENWTDEGFVMSVCPAEGGSVTAIPGKYRDLSETVITDSGRVLILNLPNEFNKTTYSMDGTDYCYEMHAVLNCFNVSDPEDRWEQEIVFSREISLELVQSSYIDPDGIIRECVVCSVADTQIIVDTLTGEIIRKAVFPARIVSLMDDALNCWVTMLDDGRVARLYYEDDCFTVSTTVAAGVRKIKRFENDGHDGLLILDTAKTAITRYEMRNTNPNYRELDELSLSYNSSSDLKKGILVSTDAEDDGNDVLTIYDTSAFKLLHRIELGRAGYNGNQFGFFSDMSAVFTVGDESSDIVYTVDIDSGALRKYVQGSAVTKSHMRACVKGEKSFLMYIDNEGNVFLSAYDVRRDDEKVLNIDIDGAGRIDRFIVNDPMTFCVAEINSGKGKELYLIDLQDGNALLISSKEGADVTGFGSTIGDVIAAYRTDDSVKIIDLDGWMLSELRFDMPSVLSMCCRSDTLFVVTSNSILTEYSCYGMEKASWSVFLENGERYNEYWPFRWKFSRDAVIFGQYTELNIVEFDQDQARIMINKSCAFDPDGKQVVIRDSTQRIVGVFHICSAKELIALGREMIGPVELTDTQKKQYGLD